MDQLPVLTHLARLLDELVFLGPGDATAGSAGRIEELPQRRTGWLEREWRENEAGVVAVQRKLFGEVDTQQLMAIATG